MKTDTVNTEKWTFNLFNEDETHVYFDIDCGEDEIGQLKLSKKYRNDDLFISTAVNACKEINPDNPLNAAKYITAMFKRLKEISEKTDKWDTTKNILDHITK